jgi:hypothetical protein
VFRRLLVRLLFDVRNLFLVRGLFLLGLFVLTVGIGASRGLVLFNVERV